MSLLMANSIYMRNSGIEVQDDNNEKEGTNYKNLRIKDLMSFYGFKDVEVYYMGSSHDQGYENGYICKNYSDTHKGAIAIGHKKVEYHGISKEVIGIVCRGTAEDDDWDNDFDLGDLELKKDIDNEISDNEDTYQEVGKFLKGGKSKKYDKKYWEELLHFAGGYPDWKHKYHHAGFDIVANRELEVLEDYLIRYDSNIDANMCYWITGHSMGAAVANLIAAHLINEEQNNVYCYTFAAPNNFYMPDNYHTATGIYMKDGTKKEIKYQVREPKEPKYRCIFNIVNRDDFIPYVPMQDCGWTKYGQEADISVCLNIPIKKIIKQQNEKLSNFERYLYVKYNGDFEFKKELIDTLNSVFSDKYTINKDGKNIDMRRSVYSSDYGEDDIYYALSNTLGGFESGLFNNAKPYQKSKELQRIDIETYIEQKQMPAYLFNVLASGNHEKELFGFITNKVKLLFAELAPRYIRARNKFIMDLDDGIKINFIHIEKPHMLEAYYYLTKIIEPTDFK